MSAYHQHMTAHTSVVTALEELDRAEAAYCRPECEKDECEEVGHIEPPSDDFFEEVASTRRQVKGLMITTMSAVLTADPIYARE